MATSFYMHHEGQRLCLGEANTAYFSWNVEPILARAWIAGCHPDALIIEDEYGRKWTGTGFLYRVARAPYEDRSVIGRLNDG